MRIKSILGMAMSFIAFHAYAGDVPFSEQRKVNVQIESGSFAQATGEYTNTDAWGSGYADFDIGVNGATADGNVEFNYSAGSNRSGWGTSESSGGGFAGLSGVVGKGDGVRFSSGQGVVKSFSDASGGRAVTEAYEHGDINTSTWLGRGPAYAETSSHSHIEGMDNSSGMANWPNTATRSSDVNGAFGAFSGLKIAH